MGIQTDGETDRWADRQIGREKMTGIQMDRQNGQTNSRQIMDNHLDRQTNRWEDRQIGRQTE